MENKIGLYFHELVTHNEAAMRHLSNIRLKYLEARREPWKAKSGMITKEYDHCITKIKEMEHLCTSLIKIINDGSLGWLHQYPKEDVQKAIAEAEEKGISPVLQLESIINGLKPSNEETNVLEELYENVERLNIDPRDTSFYSLHPPLHTAHDCIRYLHQKAIDELFSAESSGEVNSEWSNIHGGGAGDTVIKIIDATKQGIPGLSDLCFFFSHKKNQNYHGKLKEKDIPLPIRAIFHSYDLMSEEIPLDGSVNDQQINIVVLENSILAQIQLGAHYAKIESKIDDSDSFISLSYNDTNYIHAKNRMTYLQLVLQKLGYIAEVKGKNMQASLYGKQKKQMYGALCETVRLLTSSTDLDIITTIENREPEAAYRFFNGELFIAQTLLSSPRINTAEVEKFLAQYQPNWEDIDI